MMQPRKFRNKMHSNSAHFRSAKMSKFWCCKNLMFYNGARRATFPRGFIPQFLPASGFYVSTRDMLLPMNWELFCYLLRFNFLLSLLQLSLEEEEKNKRSWEELKEEEELRKRRRRVEKKKKKSWEEEELRRRERRRGVEKSWEKKKNKSWEEEKEEEELRRVERRRRVEKKKNKSWEEEKEEEELRRVERRRRVEKKKNRSWEEEKEEELKEETWAWRASIVTEEFDFDDWMAIRVITDQRISNLFSGLSKYCVMIVVPWRQ